MSDRVYGLDLITDAEGPLIDPHRDQIVGIGLSIPSDDELYEGGEPELLELLDRRLKLLPAGVISTWHGSIVAIPLIAARAARWDLKLGLTVWADRRSAPASPVAGVESASCASWHDHALLDLRRVYEASEPRRWTRRSKSRTDPEDLIPLPDDLAHRDPRKDARLARQLTERRWSKARRYVDVTNENSGGDRHTTDVAR